MPPFLSSNSILQHHLGLAYCSYNHSMSTSQTQQQKKEEVRSETSQSETSPSETSPSETSASDTVSSAFANIEYPGQHGTLHRHNSLGLPCFTCILFVCVWVFVKEKQKEGVNFGGLVFFDFFSFRIDGLCSYPLPCLLSLIKQT